MEDDGKDLLLDEERKGDDMDDLLLVGDGEGDLDETDKLDKNQLLSSML